MAGIDLNELLSDQQNNPAFRGFGLQRSQSPRQLFDNRPANVDPRTDAMQALEKLEGQQLIEEPGGTSFFDVLMSVLDAAGRPVRDAVGALTSAMRGRWEQAGRRLQDAVLAPIDLLTFGAVDKYLIDFRQTRGTTGSDILDDMGFRAGTTAEDERRIRIAMAAGMSRAEAQRKFGVYGDRLLAGEVATEFEGVLQQAKKAHKGEGEFELNTTWDDVKRATDAQDFGGLAVEILLDPLTYLSGGLTAVGKAAKAVTLLEKTAPALKQALQKAGTVSEARKLLTGGGKLLEGTTEPMRKRLLKNIERAAEEDGRLPSLFLADNFSAQAREGQRALMTLPGGKTLFKGQGLHDWLSHVGQTKIKEKFDPQLAGMDQRFFDIRPVKWATGGVKWFMQKVQDKFSTEYNVMGKKRSLDELLATNQVDVLKDVTQATRFAEKGRSAIHRMARERGLEGEEFFKHVEDFNYLTSDTVELSKRLGGNYADLANALELGLEFGKSLSVAEKGEIAEIAKGIVYWNQKIADKASQIPVKFRELNDYTIQYLHRVISSRAREEFEKAGKAKKWMKDKYGLDFRASSGTFKARDDKFRGVTTREVNERWREEFGYDLYSNDPLKHFAEGIRQTNRAIGNAKFTAGVIEEFGSQDQILRDAFFDSVAEAGDTREMAAALRVGRASAKERLAATAAEDARAAAGTLRGGQKQVVKQADRAEAQLDLGVVGQGAQDDVARARRGVEGVPGRWREIKEGEVMEPGQKFRQDVKTGKSYVWEKEGGGIVTQGLEREVGEAVAKRNIEVAGQMMDEAEIVQKLEMNRRLLTENALAVSKGQRTVQEGEVLAKALANDTRQLTRAQAQLQKEFGTVQKTYAKDIKNAENADKHFVLGLLVKEVKERFEHAISEIYRSAKGIPYAQKARFEAAEKLVAKVSKAIDHAPDFKSGMEMAKRLQQELARIMPQADLMQGTNEALALTNILNNWNEALELVNTNTLKQLNGKVRSAKAETQQAFKKWQEADPMKWGAEGFADWIHRQQQAGKILNPINDDQVSALQMYRDLGLRLPDDHNEIMELASMAVPKELHEVATRAVQTSAAPNEFIGWYDKTTNWLKQTVTQIFPAYFGRNLLENGFKSFIHGNVDQKNYADATKLLLQIYRGVEDAPKFVDHAYASMVRKTQGKLGPVSKETQDLMRQLGVGDKPEDWIDWLKAHGILENRVTSEFGEVLNDGAEGLSRAARMKDALGGVAKQLGTEGRTLKTARKINGASEDLFRVSYFFDKIRKGMSGEEAAAAVKEVFFDYRKLTNFESKYMKRLAFFYSFYRHNLRYIVGEAYKRPAITKQITNMFQSDPDNPRHGWLSDQGSFLAGAHEVALGFLPQQTFGAFSLAEGDVFDKLRGKAREVAASANPTISGVGEVIFNKDLFTDKPLVQPGGTLQEWTFAPEPLQKLVGLERTPDGRYRVDGYWNLAFQFVPSLRRFATTAGAFTEQDRSFWSALLRNTTGVNVQKREFTREDLVLLDKNLMRSAKKLDLIKRGEAGQWQPNKEKLPGRVLSALYAPSADKMQDLALMPEVAAKLYPYMTFYKAEDGETKVRLTGVLRDKMFETARELFPKESAFMDSQKIREGLTDKIKVDTQARDVFAQQAKADFEQYKQSFKPSGQMALDEILGGVR